jgi:hypothetical protein
MYKWTIVVAALLAFAACDGKGGPKILPPIDGLQAVLDALEAGTAGKSTLRGTIELVGLTPVAPVGAPTGATIMGKIIDPGDDILITTPITPGAEYQIEVDGDVDARLQLELQVEEDIDGDAQAPDTIVASVPVDLAAGKVSTADLTIRKAVVQQGAPGSDGPPVVEEVFFPQLGGEVLLLELEQSDASGSNAQIYAVTGASAVFDADGDRFVEQGDDTVYDDADQDGWPDSSEAVFAAADPVALSLEGTVSEIDRAARTLTVRAADGTETVVTVDAFASIVPVTVEGDVLGRLLLDQTLVGRQVQVYGWSVLGADWANLVVVLPVTASPQ